MFKNLELTFKSAFHQSIYLSIEGFGNRPSNTGLSYSWWSVEAKDLALGRTLELANSDEFL